MLKTKRIVNKELIQFIAHNLSCIITGTQPVDAHHVTTRKAGGNDVAENLMPLSREMHNLWHLKGPGYMIETYPAVKYWLQAAKRDDILDKHKKE